MSHWQPIETAPKGGWRTITAGKIVREMHVAPRILTFTSLGEVTLTYWIEKEGRWNMFSKNNPPTHWMPLPEPPKAAP